MATYDEQMAGQFDYARKRAKQQSQTQTDLEKEGLKRRFAALGQVNSGSAIKLENQVDQRANQILEDANQNIDAAQRAEGTRRAEVVEGRDFAANQADLQRKYLTAEREAAQGFNKNLFDIQFEYTKGLDAEKLGMANKQFEESIKQWREMFEEEKRVNAANAEAVADANKPDAQWNPSWWFGGENPLDPSNIGDKFSQFGTTPELAAIGIYGLPGIAAQKTGVTDKVKSLFKR